MIKYDSATPYIAVFVLLRKANKAAFLMRQNTGWMDGYYDTVAGKVEVGETYRQAAVREAKEEAGVDIRPEDLTYILTAHRNSDSNMTWVDVVFEVRKWQGEPYNAEPDKHSSLDWLDLDNLPDNVAPPGRYRLEQIAAGHSYAEYGWGE
jgi:8-oxo-dGTP pyrophosphatase MutT (NUDIX family)